MTDTKAEIARVEKKWGTKIIHYKLDGKYSGLLNGNVHVPIKGV
jgi:hypothetical protein